VKRRNRLRGRRDFAAVRARKLVVRSGPLRCHAAPNQLGVARVGFAIPKATGGAVVRNRLRRRLRALLLPRLAELAGVDVVVAAAPIAASLPAGELDAHLARCLRGVEVRLRPGSNGGGAERGVVNDNGGLPTAAPSGRLTFASRPA